MLREVGTTMSHSMTTRRPTLGRAFAAALTGAGMALAGALVAPASPAAAATVPSTSTPRSAAPRCRVPRRPCPCGATRSTGGPSPPRAARSIEVTEGDVVTSPCTTTLGERTSLLFQGQLMAPDLTGRRVRWHARSTPFTADHAGTYLYEAGLLRSVAGGTEHQAAMGLLRRTGRPPGYGGPGLRRRLDGLRRRPGAAARARSTRRSTTPPTRRPSTCASSRPSTP